jgi:hypothetical protein
MDPRGAVEAAVLLEHCCHLSGDGSVLLGPVTGDLLPLTPGIEAAGARDSCLHSQHTEMRSARVSIRRNLSAAAAHCIYEAQPSGPEAIVHCRQP